MHGPTALLSPLAIFNEALDLDSPSQRAAYLDRACAGGHWHSGIDLAAARGTPVVATLPGIVTVIVSPTGYGLHVVIDHGGGLSSLYGHLDTVVVASGDVVTAGQVIGTVGSTGNATGPHLHFEIRRDGIAEDPLLDLALP